MTHGTLEHAEWLLMVVKEGKDVINSAAGWGQLASPVTAAEIEARAELQDRAGASKAVDNVRERSALEILKKLACHVEKPDRTQCFVATCPHCDHQWLIEELGGRSNHTCPVLRQWVLPILHATWTEQLKQEKEDAAIIAAVDGEDADLESASVTRASFPGILPWEFGESITEDEGWAVAGNSTISKKKKRAKRAGSRTDPLHIRALDEFRGRITRQCFKTEKLVNAAQLLAHPLASCLFEDGKPLPAGEIVFVKLADFLKREEFKQWLVETKGIPRSDIEAAMQGEQTWLASDASLGEPSFTTVLFNQTVTLLKGQKMKVVLPSLSRAEIEAAYMEKIALRSLRPYNYDWETGEDRRR